jgi:peptide/nickel transport system permease protein
VIRVILSRLGGLVLVLLFLSATLFVLRQASPGDPAKQILGANASPSALAAERHKLWLDRPLPAQYLHYLAGLLHGDLGTSVRTQRPVAGDLARYVPPSLELIVLALIVAVLLGALIGVLSGVRMRGTSVVDNTLIALASIPSFLLGLLAVIVFYAHLYWLPAGGQTGIFDAPTGPTHVVLLDAIINGRTDVLPDAIEHLVLPVLVLAVGPAVAIGRVFRSNLTTTMNSDYIRTARAKGLSESRIVRRHAVRPSSGSALAMIGLQAGGMFASLAVVEIIFAWPGVGAYVAQSIPSGDFPGVAGVALVAGAAYVVINTVVDLLQVVADPRVRI